MRTALRILWLITISLTVGYVYGQGAGAVATSVRQAAGLDGMDSMAGVTVELLVWLATLAALVSLLNRMAKYGDDIC